MTENKSKEKKLNYDLKMETAVISWMLIGLPEAKWICTTMDPKWFYGARNVKIFEIIKENADNNIAPDYLLLRRWLSDKGILGECGGTEYLDDCMDVHTQVHTAQYVKQLRQLFFDRKIIGSANAMVTLPTAKNMELLRQHCFDRESAGSSNITDFSDPMGMITELTNPQEGGLYDIFGEGMEKSDDILNAMMPGNILTIGARPAVGKTVISTQALVAFSERYKETALYFSTEMSKEETLMRILTPMTKVPGWKFRKRVFSEDGEDIRKIIKAGERLSKMKILVNDKPSPTLEDIRAGILSTKAKLVIVDYIQRLRMPKARIRNEALEEIMVGLKNMARDIGCVIIILSQLDRETDHLTGKGRPQLADLKGSGAIEAESDSIGLMWRYNKKDPHRPKEKLVPDIDGIRPVEFIWAKNRHGQSDVSVQLIFDEKYIKFREWTKDDKPKKKELPNEKIDPDKMWDEAESFDAGN